MGHRPISLRIPDSDLKKIDEISTKENIKRSVVIQKAVKKYLEMYNGNETTSLLEVNKKIDELERKFSLLLSRVNILTNQIDRIVKKNEENKGNYGRTKPTTEFDRYTKPIRFS